MHKNARTMKLRPRDVISYQGQDFVVEGVLSYKLGARSTLWRGPSTATRCAGSNR